MIQLEDSCARGKGLPIRLRNREMCTVAPSAPWSAQLQASQDAIAEYPHARARGGRVRRVRRVHRYQVVDVTAAGRAGLFRP